MTPADLQAKLDGLLKLPAETEWVESREARPNFDSDDLGKYFSALSNEANLKGETAGWLVFGVQDQPPKVVGAPASFALPQNADLGTARSVAVTNSPTVVAGQNQTVLSPSAARQFYRLKAAP